MPPIGNRKASAATNNGDGLEEGNEKGLELMLKSLKKIRVEQHEDQVRTLISIKAPNKFGWNLVCVFLLTCTNTHCTYSLF